MNSTVDLYLGAFLILCGFILSLLNLRRLVKDGNTFYSSVLMSENILLMCIGISFIIRYINTMGLLNMEMPDIEERIREMDIKDSGLNCNFLSVLKSYGPLIISLVNSFISLVIDNYMHYRLLADEENDTVQEFHELQRVGRNTVSKLFTFLKKYFSYLAVTVQWIVPVIIALFMYPMEIKEMQLPMNNLRSNTESCMAMIDITNGTCISTNFDGNYSLEVRKFIPIHYIEANENLVQNDSIAAEIRSIISNVIKVIADVNNETHTDGNVTSRPLWRNGKTHDNCMSICYVENKSLLLYMFTVTIVTYFIPITISTVILTKIHVMNIKKPSVKTYVSRELLYNILFWTPVMFDTFLSLLQCSFSTNGLRPTIFNIIANVYQAVKNFMNTKYFQDNSVRPI